MILCFSTLLVVVRRPHVGRPLASLTRILAKRMGADEEVLRRLAGIGHVFLHGIGGVMTTFAGICRNLLQLALAGMRRVAGDAGELAALIVRRLDESLILLVMLSFLEDVVRFGKIIDDEQPFQVALVLRVERLVCLNTGDTDVSRIPFGPVVTRFVTVSHVRSWEVFAGIPLSCLVLLVFNAYVAVATDL